jgi:hypothetical protein
MNADLIGDVATLKAYQNNLPGLQRLLSNHFLEKSELKVEIPAEQEEVKAVDFDRSPRAKPM